MKKNSFMRMFKFMNKQIYPYFFGIILIALFTFLFEAIAAIMFKEMFDSLEEEKVVFNNVMKPVKLYMPFFIGVLIVRPLLGYIVVKSSTITTGNMRKTLFSKIKRLPMKYFRDHHSGEVISRFTNDVVEAEKVYSTHLNQFLTLFLAGIGTTILAFFINWQLSILVIISASITLLINGYFARKLRNVSTEVQEKLANFTTRLTNLLDGMHVIRCFNISRLILGKYDDANKDVLDKNKERVNINSIVRGLNEIVQMISFVGVATFGAYLNLKGVITLGVIIAIVQLQNTTIQLISRLGNFITNIQSSLAAADRVFEVLDEEEEPITYQTLLEEKILDDYAVLLENLSFSYDKEKVLDQVSLKLPKDKVYAIVGPSGGGKSTIFKLVLSFYPPSEGDVMVNGYHNTIKEIRDQIAYVPQDAHLFSGTIAENIGYGNLNASLDDIKEAARLANADGFISEMKDGYDTYVGENGAQLSGGQRQRIAIARAILKNAPILLLDEATSALDSESEQLVQDALDRLMENKSTLVIAHRLSTIEHADQILVLKDGKMQEQGTHTELLNLNGIYSSLYNQQFKKLEA